jgi:phospholipid/cholesterol/gamma-HCH transport system permease protein
MPRTIALTGPVTLASIAETRARLGAGPDAAVIDLSAVTALDTAGAWLVAGRQRATAGTGESAGSAEEMGVIGATPAQVLLLRTVAAAMPTAPPGAAPRRPARSATDHLATLGQAVSRAAGSTTDALGFLGLVMARLGRTALHPSRLRVTALVHHMHQAGLNAVPIVALMGFLIGIVLAFQGAAQLRQFGAEVFVVDLIAISILRELGILLTAIIVAGRSASAFTAAIGSMKMREEIDAMQTLGIDPAEALFLPRILALLLMLPILGLIANVTGLLGGLIMSWVELNISPAMFVTRLVEGTSVNHAIVGMVKAPVFAVIIGVVGVHAGMKVQSNAESLGRMTSASVVTAIFAVIVADALFSIFFARYGI